MKKIINFTPTGTQTTRENSFAPLEENEIIDSVIEANELGITLVHLHARDENLKNTYKIKHFSKLASINNPRFVFLNKFSELFS